MRKTIKVEKQEGGIVVVTYNAVELEWDGVDIELISIDPPDGLSRHMAIQCAQVNEQPED